MVIGIVTMDVCRRGTIQNDYCYSHMGCLQEVDDTEWLLLLIYMTSVIYIVSHILQGTVKNVEHD